MQQSVDLILKQLLLKVGFLGVVLIQRVIFLAWVVLRIVLIKRVVRLV